MSDADITPYERLQSMTVRAVGRLPARLQIGLSGRAPVSIDGQTLDPQLQLILTIRRRLNPYGLCAPSPAAARARFRREMLVFGGPQTQVGAVREFDIPGEGGPLRVRHYAPPDANGGSREMLVFLHGGGFVIGDLDTHDEACRLLCRNAHTHVLSVNYRLAPEHPFPAALHDALTALRWAQQNASTFVAEPARVALGGDSAGANLTAVATQLSAREGTGPAAQLLIYPPTDATTPRASQELFGEGFFLSNADRDAFIRHYAGGTDRESDDPRISPLLAADLSGLPPALLVTAGFDMLRDEGEAYADALRAAAKRKEDVRARRFPSLGHGFINMTGVCPAARRAVEEIAQEWRKLLERAGH